MAVNALGGGCMEAVEFTVLWTLDVVKFTVSLKRGRRVLGKTFVEKVGNFWAWNKLARHDEPGIYLGSEY